MSVSCRYHNFRCRCRHPKKIWCRSVGVGVRVGPNDGPGNWFTILTLIWSDTNALLFTYWRTRIHFRIRRGNVKGSLNTSDFFILEALISFEKLKEIRIFWKTEQENTKISSTFSHFPGENITTYLSRFRCQFSPVPVPGTGLTLPGRKSDEEEAVTGKFNAALQRWTGSTATGLDSASAGKDCDEQRYTGSMDPVSDPVPDPVQIWDFGSGFGSGSGSFEILDPVPVFKIIPVPDPKCHLFVRKF